MILIDAGPLIALLNADDPHHTRCVEAAKPLMSPLLTTWPCFTEAMYLLGSMGGYGYQETLWKMHQSGRLMIHDLTTVETIRMATLMKTYQDTPMDMADASLVVAAESLGIQAVFTLDSDFYIYRMANGTVLNVIP